MIDIHCHLLPGLDDGPSSLEESLVMVRRAFEQGVTDIVATPHHLNGRYVNPAPVVREAVDALNWLLDREKVPVRVHAGQEVHVTSKLIEELEVGRLLPLGDTNYMLLELPFIIKESYLLELFHELRIREFTPIIAHPERHSELNRNTDLLSKLVEKGAVLQVTTHSLRGRFGAFVSRSAIRMCREGFVHLLSSDAHDSRVRGCDLKSAYEFVSREIGDKFAEIYKNNAERVLNDLPVDAAAQTKKLRKAWFF
jgi:protein-tyrosine phosphatase